MSQGSSGALSFSGPNLRLNRVELFFFGLILATISLVLDPYTLGLDDHISQIPIILRMMDSTFLTNDFYVNAVTTLGPRYFYAHLVAFFATFVGLTKVMFLLTWISYAGVAWITLVAARRLFPDNDPAVMMACLLVMAFKGIRLGGGLFLIEPYLLPRLLAMPLVLWAFYLGLTGRLVGCALVSMLATLLHPLNGPVVGLLALGSHASWAVWESFRGRGKPFRALIRELGLVLGLILVIVVVVYLVFMRIQGHAPDSAKYIDIISFRLPHHYLPSHFGLKAYIASLVFLFTVSVSFYWGLKETRLARVEGAKAGLAIAYLLLLCLGGYVFVEVLPWNLWTNLQAFRFLIILKWLGYILIGATLAKFLTERSSFSGTLPGWLMLVGSGREVPFSLAWGHLVEISRGYLSTRLPRPIMDFLLGLSILVGALILYHSGDTPEELAKVVLFALVCLWFLAASRSWLRVSVPLVLALLVIGVGLSFPNLPVLGTRLSWTYTHDTADYRALSAYAAEKTTPQALFLAPPMFGEFRYTAGRSLVVDFKCISWQYEAIAAWYERIKDCYGQVETGGWMAPQSLDKNYRRTTPENVLRVARKYGATHAVLYTETYFPRPPVYENKTYKLVELGD